MDFADIFGIITGITAVAVSIWSYIHGLNRERKTDTLAALKEIRKKYDDTTMLPEKEKQHYLKEMEFFATGLNLGIYELDVIDKMSGGRLISQYNKWAKDLIRERRKISGTATAYCEYENMIERLKRKRAQKK